MTNCNGHSFNKADFRQMPATIPETLRHRLRWMRVEQSVHASQVGLNSRLAAMPDCSSSGAKVLINLFKGNSPHNLAVIYVVFVPDVLRNCEWTVYVGETKTLNSRWMNSYATSATSHMSAITNVIQQPDAKDHRVAADVAMAAAAMGGMHSLLVIVESFTGLADDEVRKARQTYWINHLAAMSPFGLNIKK
jgi:predicted transcriptional regulator